MRYFKFLLVISLLLMGGFSGAMEMEGQKFEEKMKIGEDELVLNGIGMRRARVMGFPVKVYVGGVYVEKKSSDPEVLMKSEKPKVILLKFVRKVDKEKLTEGWTAGVKKNCKVDCENWKQPVKEFNKAMVDVKKNSTIEMQLLKDTVKVTVKGRVKNTEKSIASASLGPNLLAVFLGEKPPNKGLKKGLLGLK